MPVSKKYNTFIYQLRGYQIVNDNEKIEDIMLILFKNDAYKLRPEVRNDARFVFITDEPIKEIALNYYRFL